MRVPRVRFTVRRLMVAVAVVALALGAGKLRRRSNEFRELAGMHASEVGSYLSHARLWDRGQDGGCMSPASDASIPSPEDYARGAQWCHRWAAYESQLSRKYEYAAAHPWLTVEPDPPKPK